MADQKQKPQQPDYDKLNQVEFLLADDRSPFIEQLRQFMAPYEAQVQAGKLSKEQYKQLGAQHTMELLGKEFGGAVPDRRAAENFDFDRRSLQMMQDPKFKGSREDALGELRKGEAPYSRAYSIIEALKRMAQPPQPPSPQAGGISEPGQPTPTRPPASNTAPTPTPPPRIANPQTDDEKLADAQLQMLYNMVLGPAGPEDIKKDFGEVDKYRFPLPETKAEEGVPQEQQVFNDYKKMFSDWAMGNRGGEMPLPPGWARSPSGVPISSPAEQAEAASGGIDKATREKLIWENMNRLLRQEAGTD